MFKVFGLIFGAFPCVLGLFQCSDPSEYCRVTKETEFSEDGERDVLPGETKEDFHEGFSPEWGASVWLDKHSHDVMIYKGGHWYRVLGIEHEVGCPHFSHEYD